MLSLKETLRRMFGRPAIPSRTRRAPSPRRLRLEWLEDRRLLCDLGPGSLDESFDVDGKVTTAIGSGDDRGLAMVVQADGKIVAAGNSHNGKNRDFALVRYNANGSLDASFSGDGKQITTFGSSYDEGINAIALQTDGKIVAAGFTVKNGQSGVDFAIARYNPNGSLDTSFDGDGKRSTTFASGSSEEARALAIQADGKIVVGGYTIANGSQGDDFALARYNANGSLDTSFGSGGKVITDIGTHATIGSLLIQADGRIVVAGWAGFTQDFSHGELAMARYNPNGTLDSSFGTGGIVTTVVGDASSRASSLAQQPDGKLVAAGTALFDVPGYNVYAVVRYNTDGTLDSTFDNDGKVTIDFGGSGGAGAVTVQGDGKIVVAGSEPTPAAFGLARLDTNGALDLTFGTGGMVTTAFDQANGSAKAVAIQADGKIVAAGTVGGGGTKLNFAVARYCA